jgi:hypothetical protein
MRRILAVTLAGLLLVPAIALGQTGVKEVGQVTCTPPTSGGTPTKVVIQRATAPVNASSAWTDLFSLDLPSSQAQQVVDATRPSGVGQQYRCVYSNAGGSTPTQPSAVFTFIDIAPPGSDGKVNVIIITVPAN